MKKTLFFILGWICLGLAYLGMVTPGLPWSIFIVSAAYCFAKSSDKMHNWIYSHPKFGPFLTNWTEKKVFPRKMKYLMIITMSTTFLFLLVTAPLKAVVWSGAFMFLVAVWAWRFPDTVEEHQRRIKNGEKIGWLK
jgi:uncharacterized membrane protein YbaN (DUF454 family)